MKIYALLPILFLLVGCDESDYKLAVKREEPAEKPKTKWKVEGQGYFKAGYGNNPREILIITSPAGKKYLAITGCGVAEIHEQDDGNGNTSHVEE